MREFISDNIVSFFMLIFVMAFLPIAKKKAANYIPQKNEKGYYVIMPKTQNIFFGCTFFLLGFLFFCNNNKRLYPK